MARRKNTNNMYTHMIEVKSFQLWQDAGMIEWRALFGASIDNARKWRDAADWSPEEANAYRVALRDHYGAEEAAAFRAHGFTPDEALAWAKSGHAPDLAARERAIGKCPRRQAHGIMRTR